MPCNSHADKCIEPGGLIGRNPSRLAHIALAIIFALFTPTAFAYIDPNTGGYIFQLLAPLLALATTAWMFFSDRVKAIWYSILRFFSFKPRQSKTDKN
jgi:hypothetical protein